MIDSNIKDETIKTYNEVGSLIEKGELKSALNKVMDYVSLGNKYYDEQTPWIKVKENIEEFNNITYTCTYMIANIANLIKPFLPFTSEKICSMIGLKDPKWEEIVLDGDINILSNDLLFNRIDDNKKEKIMSEL